LLEFAYSNIELRTICEIENRAKSKLGERASVRLKHRLADLRAATSIKDIVAGRPRILDDKTGQLMSIDLSDGFRIIFCANHANNPLTEAGKIDWPKVNRIKILRIENDYDYDYD